MCIVKAQLLAVVGRMQNVDLYRPSLIDTR